MNINLLSVFIALTLAAGLILFIEKVWIGRPVRHKSQLAEAARVVFPILLILLLLRAFVIQNYRVQTTAMEPTLRTGDFTFVNQFFYGVHLPLNHALVFRKHEPKRGQVVVLYWPVNPSVHVMKRVIGIPGDHISYMNHVLYVNDQALSQITLHTQGALEMREESLGGRQYQIQVNPSAPALDFEDVVVPPGEYFVMNDNREDTEDSRSFGFVPLRAFEGQVFMVWMSWNQYTHHIRWYRLGERI